MSEVTSFLKFGYTFHFRFFFKLKFKVLFFCFDNDDDDDGHWKKKFVKREKPQGRDYSYN